MATTDGTRYTPVELIRLTAEYFSGKNIESPRLEAEVLLSGILGVRRLDLYLQYDKPLTGEEVAAFRKWVKRRAGGEPTAYILGKREFWSLDFKVKPGVLIPRPDTEVLVEAALSVMGEDGDFLDIGVGSGAICVSLLKEKARWRATGVDLSPEALEVTGENASRHGVSEHLTLIEGSLFEPVRGKLFDMVISNPPYIPRDDIKGLEREVSAHEPRLALDGGEDGLSVIREIAAEAGEFLAPGGYLLLEYGLGQAGEVEEILTETGNFGEVEIIKDYAGLERVARAKIAE